MTIELKGTVHSIKTKQQITDNLTKQEIWLTIDGDTQYPQTVVIQAINAKTDLLNGISMGQNVKASVNVKGRIHGDNCYNSFDLWKIE